MEVGTPPCPALASSLADLPGHPGPDTKKGLVQSLQEQRGRGEHGFPHIL